MAIALIRRELYLLVAAPLLLALGVVAVSRAAGKPIRQQRRIRAGTG
jgi:hypothetical protein